MRVCVRLVNAVEVCGLSAKRRGRGGSAAATVRTNEGRRWRQESASASTSTREAAHVRASKSHARKGQIESYQHSAGVSAGINDAADRGAVPRATPDEPKVRRHLLWKRGGRNVNRV